MTQHSDFSRDGSQQGDRQQREELRVHRVAYRSYMGTSSRGVQIPIGQGDGEVSPGELLKLALMGCAGMSSDTVISRRLGDDYRVTLTMDAQYNKNDDRFESFTETLHIEAADLDETTQEKIRDVATRAIGASCTIAHTVQTSAPVEHQIVFSNDTNDTSDAAEGGQEKAAGISDQESH